MKLSLEPNFARRLSTMSSNELAAWLAKCRPQDLLMLDAAFELWAAKGQIEPDETGWRVWLMMAGRGFGKTRAGAEWVHRLASEPKRLGKRYLWHDAPFGVELLGRALIEGFKARRRKGGSGEDSSEGRSGEQA